MDFARKQMEKYGWTDGKGLGKKEDGIRTAIKPKLKFDNAGIGHDMSKEFVDNWWEKLYNNASNNVDVNVQGDNVEMKLKSGESIDITTKGLSSRKFNKKDLEFGSFIKTAKLTENGIFHLRTKDAVEEPATFTPKNNLTDDELLAACGGRTAHKGARHGLNLNGKLSRLEKQEKVLLKKFKNVSLTDKGDIEKKLKKLDKHKIKSLSKLEFDDTKSTDSTETLIVSRKKHKKHCRKRVSFNETVTEYHSQDLDANSESVDNDFASERQAEVVILTTNIKQENEDNNNIEDRLNSPPPADVGVLDEGIEQDIEVDVDKAIDHKSFEEAQTTDFMSKEQRKLLKKTRRSYKKKKTATARFLEEMYEHNVCRKRNHKEHVDEAENSTKKSGATDSNRKSKKRKMYWEHEERMNSMVRTLNQKCKISDTE